MFEASRPSETHEVLASAYHISREHACALGARLDEAFYASDKWAGCDFDYHAYFKSLGTRKATQYLSSDCVSLHELWRREEYVRAILQSEPPRCSIARWRECFAALRGFLIRNESELLRRGAASETFIESAWLDERIAAHCKLRVEGDAPRDPTSLLTRTREELLQCKIALCDLFSSQSSIEASEEQLWNELLEALRRHCSRDSIAYSLRLEQQAFGHWVRPADLSQLRVVEPSVGGLVSLFRVAGAVLACVYLDDPYELASQAMSECLAAEHVDLPSILADRQLRRTLRDAKFWEWNHALGANQRAYQRFYERRVLRELPEKRIRSRAVEIPEDELRAELAGVNPLGDLRLAVEQTAQRTYSLPPGTTWSDLEVTSTSEPQALEFQLGDARYRLTAADLGLIDQRNGRASLNWRRLLEVVAGNVGGVGALALPTGKRHAFEQGLVVVRARLRSAFGLQADPLPHDRSVRSWATAFRVHPDFRL